MMKVEVWAWGRILRVRVAWEWRRPWAACCRGVCLVEGGPVAVSVAWRRVWWERP